MARRLLFRNAGALATAGALALLVASACLVTAPQSPDQLDGGFLGSCTGMEARVVPKSACPDLATACCGTVAFALCTGTTYTDCSCALLSGYRLVNAAGEAADAEGLPGGDCGAGEGGEGAASDGGDAAASPEGAPTDSAGPDASRG